MRAPTAAAASRNAARASAYDELSGAGIGREYRRGTAAGHREATSRRPMSPSHVAPPMSMVSAMMSVVADPDSDRRSVTQRADAALEATEKVVYLGIAGLLLIACVVLLAVAAKDLADVFDDFGTSPVVETLDTLLLLFILVELLSAVRITIAKRELVAEPFLLVGIIASIKEIVVLSVKAAESIGEGPKFEETTSIISCISILRPVGLYARWGEGARDRVNFRPWAGWESAAATQCLHSTSCRIAFQFSR